MAGIRLGMCFASEAIIATLNKIKPPYNINELTQISAIEQLQKADLVQSQIMSLINERELLVRSLDQVAFIKKIYPSNTNFVMIKVDDASKRYQQLIENGIVIRNRTTQPLCENCLRLTIGTTEENMKLIETLKQL